MILCDQSRVPVPPKVIGMLNSFVLIPMAVIFDISSDMAFQKTRLSKNIAYNLPFIFKSLLSWLNLVGQQSGLCGI